MAAVYLQKRIVHTLNWESQVQGCLWLYQGFKFRHINLRKKVFDLPARPASRMFGNEEKLQGESSA